MRVSGFISAFLLVIGFVVLIWAIASIDSLLGLNLGRFGIRPRDAGAAIGIVVAPFIHAGIGHVASNTPPLLILGGFASLEGRRVLLLVSAFIVLVSGAAVWLIARPSIHIGASGLVFGLFGYLVARGWYDRRSISILIAAITVLLYGGAIFLNVLPIQSFVSWEGHLAGLVAGALAARVRRRRDA